MERSDTIMFAPYPTAENLGVPASWDADAQKMETVIALIKAVRELRARHGIKPGAKIPLVLAADDPAGRELLATATVWLRDMAGAGTVEILEAHEPSGRTASATCPLAKIFIPLGDVPDDPEKTRRDDARLSKLRAALEQTERKLANPEFVAKAPAEVVAAERSRRDELATKVGAGRGSEGESE